MVTVALAITAPEGSITVPESEVELAPCAFERRAAPNNIEIKMAAIIPARPLR
jgi:hypothetical protein